jgi:tRNA A37 threonylcarbamoyladenosine dehydratase
VDLDHIAESNINRQVHALDGEIGRAKVLAMAQRIGLINPSCQLTVVDAFLDADNAPVLLAPCDGIIDAVDDVRAKIAMALFARASRRPLAICGGAGAKRDLTRLHIDDLALVRNDALLARLRSRLRAEHGFPKGAPRGKPARFGLTCIHLDEAPPTLRSAGGLNCAGYGSVVHVTAGLGLAASGWMIDQLIQAATPHQEAGISSCKHSSSDGSEDAAN